MDALVFAGASLAVAGALRVRKRRKENIVVPDERTYAEKIQTLTSTEDAINQLQLILDFDRTITTFYYDKVAGVKGASCHGIVEHEWDGQRKARAEAYNAFYYPIEVDVHRTVEEKIPFMEDWYGNINELIVDSGLTHDELIARVSSAPVKLRPGVVQLLDWTVQHAVPVTVFSAGITNVAEEVLRQLWRSPLPPTLRVVSNEMVFHPETGRITGFKDPLLHMFNKVAGTAEQVSPAWMQCMRERRHVLLVGDGLGDAAMADGLHPGMKVQPRGTRAGSSEDEAEAERRVLRVGLCNVNVSTLLPQYCALYDLVITEDGPLDEVLAITRRIAVPL